MPGVIREPISGAGRHIASPSPSQVDEGAKGQGRHTPSLPLEPASSSWRGYSRGHESAFPLRYLGQHFRLAGEGKVAHDVHVLAAATRAPVLMRIVPAVLWLEIHIEVLVDAAAARAVSQYVPDASHVRHICASLSP